VDTAPAAAAELATPALTSVATGIPMDTRTGMLLSLASLQRPRLVQAAVGLFQPCFVDTHTA